MKTLIIGLGSPHGDDQIGWNIVNQLSAIDPSHQKMIFFTSCGNGLDWLHCLQNAGRVIFIDAVKSGASPGAIFHLGSGDLQSSSVGKDTSSHRFPLQQSIQLACNLGLLNVPYEVYAIEISNTAPMSDVSDIVSEAGKILVANIAHSFCVIRY